MLFSVIGLRLTKVLLLIFRRSNYTLKQGEAKSKYMLETGKKEVNMYWVYVILQGAFTYLFIHLIIQKCIGCLSYVKHWVGQQEVASRRCPCTLQLSVSLGRQMVLKHKNHTEVKLQVWQMFQRWSWCFTCVCWKIWICVGGRVPMEIKQVESWKISKQLGKVGGWEAFKAKGMACARVREPGRKRLREV